MHAHFSGHKMQSSRMGGYCAVASFVCNLLIGCGMRQVTTPVWDVDVDVDVSVELELKLHLELDQEHEVAAFSLAMRFVQTGNLIRRAKAYANARPWCALNLHTALAKLAGIGWLFKASISHKIDCQVPALGLIRTLWPSGRQWLVLDFWTSAHRAWLDWKWGSVPIPSPPARSPRPRHLDGGQASNTTQNLLAKTNITTMKLLALSRGRRFCFCFWLWLWFWCSDRRDLSWALRMRLEIEFFPPSKNKATNAMSIYMGIVSGPRLHNALRK